MSQKTRLYSPPDGYFDLPFTWAFDASIFANGSSPLGSSIYLLGGYGNFLARRVVGLNRILAADGTGKFQIARKSRNVYLSSDPVQAPNSPELAIVPAEPYLETGKIWFDLYGINLPSAPLTAQLAFQGVRRQAGTQRRANYKHFPKTFTYEVKATLTSLAGSGVVLPTFTPIVDYDFELYNLIIMSAPIPGPVIGDADVGFTEFVAVNGATPTVIILQNVSGVPNQSPTISLVGKVLTLTSGTNSLGAPVILVPNFDAVINSFPGVSALLVVRTFLGDFDFSPDVGFSSGGNLVTPGSTSTDFTFLSNPPPLSYAAISSPVSSLTVFDSNKVALSNLPILDIFYDGGPGSPYENGAVVPPLLYPKDTVLEIDFTSQITSAGNLPTSVIVYLVGRQLIPC
jgi:hypothetical protein